MKDEVSDFDLGQFSGTVKNLLWLAKNELKFSDFNTKLVQSEDKKIYIVSVFFSEGKFVEGTKEVLDSLEINVLTAKLQLDSAPSKDPNSTPSRVKLAGKCLFCEFSNSKPKPKCLGSHYSF